MTKNENEQLIEKIQAVRNILPSGDLELVKQKVMAQVRSTPAQRRSWWKGSFIFNISMSMRILLAVLLLFGVSGGVALASQNDLPDEPLYPVKLWTERAEEAFALSPEAKIDLAATFADRRSEELNALLLRGPRHGQSRDHFVTAVNRMADHLSMAETKLAALAEKHPDRALVAAARLQAHIAVAGNILEDAKVLDNDNEHTAALKKVKEKFDDMEEKVDRVTDAVEKKTAADHFEGSARGLLRALSRKSNEVMRKHDRLTAAGFVFTKKTEAGLASAKEKMTQAQTLFDQKKFRESFVVAKESLRLFIGAQLEMNGDRARAHFKKDEPNSETNSEPRLKIRMESNANVSVANED